MHPPRLCSGEVDSCIRNALFFGASQRFSAALLGEQPLRKIDPLLRFRQVILNILEALLELFDAFR